MLLLFTKHIEDNVFVIRDPLYAQNPPWVSLYEIPDKSEGLGPIVMEQREKEQLRPDQKYSQYMTP